MAAKLKTNDFKQVGVDFTETGGVRTVLWIFGLCFCVGDLLKKRLYTSWAIED